MPGISLRTALRRFGAYLGSGGGFRGHHEGVKRQLIGILWVMSRAGNAVLGEGAGYG
jgi:hypothetical protein